MEKVALKQFFSIRPLPHLHIKWAIINNIFFRESSSNFFFTPGPGVNNKPHFFHIIVFSFKNMASPHSITPYDLNTFKKSD
jgi:hypothetical protein